MLVSNLIGSLQSSPGTFEFIDLQLFLQYPFRMKTVEKDSYTILTYHLLDLTRMGDALRC